jgi:hypothetical protein
MAFVILEQIFVSATVLTICIMSDGYYYNPYSGYSYGWADASWTWANFTPLMIWGWAMASGSLYTLCKMKKWE